MNSDANYELATLGAGCFWGVEAILSKVPGIQDTEVGYCGGHMENPDYKSVCRGDSGHAEVIQVKFDPSQIQYSEVLDYFWRLHDPTQLNRQGPDVGTQYRSAIFFHSEEQKQMALKSRDEAAKDFAEKIVTEISPAQTFYPAEDYHQDYFDKNPGPICHILRPR